MEMRSVLGVFLLLLTGCSLVVAKEQCRVTSDCRSRGQAFAGHVCSPEGYCVPLLAPPACPAVLTSRKDGAITDDTILLGHIAARTGMLAGLGQGSERAAELALSEWGLHPQGAPTEPGAPARPLAVVLCDEANAEVAARHLVQTLHAPALFGGPISSARTRDIAERVTIPGGALMVASFSAAPEISDLKDQNLVWRTAQSTAAEVTAMALFIERLAGALRQKGVGPKVRMFSFFYQDDLYGAGLHSTLVNQLPEGGYERMARSPGRGDKEGLQSARADAVKQLPHIVNILGTADLVGDFLIHLEMEWPPDKPRPIYLVPEGMKDASALAKLATLPLRPMDELPKRIYLFSPRVDPVLAVKYRDRFMARFPGQPIGSPATYDAMYLIGYSLVTLNGKPVTGANLANGMRRMVGGAKKIVAGPSPLGSELGGLLQGIAELQAGKDIDYRGVSGELEFDLMTGDPKGDYSIECVTINIQEKTADFQSTGLAYTALLNRSNLLGTYQEASCPCVTCPTTP